MSASAKVSEQDLPTPPLTPPPSPITPPLSPTGVRPVPGIIFERNSPAPGHAKAGSFSSLPRPGSSPVPVLLLDPPLFFAQLQSIVQERREQQALQESEQKSKAR